MFSRKQKNDSSPTSKTIRLAFVTGGGYGDSLIFANYLYCLKKKFSQYPLGIDVYFSAGYKLADTILQPGDICTGIYSEKDGVPTDNYDCVIWFCRYPKVETVKRKKVMDDAPLLYEYLQSCETFYSQNNYLFDNSPYLDGFSAERCLMKGKTRIQQSDFDDSLGIGPDFAYTLFLNGDCSEFFMRTNIEGKFITIHRGNDVAYSGTAVKLWPLEYYNELIRLLKTDYPEYTIIQIGVSRDRCPAMEGIDIDLVGKTTMEEVKILMKYSSLHIDSEGGFVHLRKNLRGGKSVVLFGPTSMEFYAYHNNINIRGDGCVHPCEWVTTDWIVNCPRGFKHPVCMSSIDPAMVIRRIHEEWK